jgi:hypothetical protein
MKTLFLILAVSSAFGSIAAKAQAQSCQPADSVSVDMLAEIKQLMLPTKNSLRTKLQLPIADTSQITLVTDQAVCARGLVALDSLIHATNPDAPVNLPGRNLYVVSIGSYKGLVDPTASAGEWVPIYFFDDLWTYVSMVIGWG